MTCPSGRFGRFCCGLLSLSLFLGATGPALADSDKDLAHARATFQRAIELEQAGNYAAAVDLFREVGQFRMTPQVRFHIATCEGKLGRLVTALGGFELALAEADTVGPDFRAEVQSSVDELRERIPKLVIVRGSGADAAIIDLDGVELGSTSIGTEVPIDPGPHAITARAPGFVSFDTTVKVDERAVERVEVILEPKSEGSDDEDEGPTVVKRQRSNTLAYVVGGVGVASLAASGVLFVLRQNALSDLESVCDNKSCPPDSASTYDSFRTYHYAGFATLGLGVAAVGTAAVLLLTRSNSTESPKTVTVIPVFGPRVAGGSLDVAF